VIFNYYEKFSFKNVVRDDIFSSSLAVFEKRGEPRSLTISTFSLAANVKVIFR